MNFSRVLNVAEFGRDLVALRSWSENDGRERRAKRKRHRQEEEDGDDGQKDQSQGDSEEVEMNGTETKTWTDKVDALFRPFLSTTEQVEEAIVQTLKRAEEKYGKEILQLSAERVPNLGNPKTKTTPKKKRRPSNQPKRPANPFLFFSHHKNREVAQAHPHLKRSSDVLKKLGEIWRGMSDDEKEIYRKMAAKDKERYFAEIEALKNAGEGSKEDAERRMKLVNSRKEMFSKPKRKSVKRLTRKDIRDISRMIPNNVMADAKRGFEEANFLTKGFGGFVNPKTGKTTTMRRWWTNHNYITPLMKQERYIESDDDDDCEEEEDEENEERRTKRPAPVPLPDDAFFLHVAVYRSCKSQCTHEPPNQEFLVLGTNYVTHFLDHPSMYCLQKEIACEIDMTDDRRYLYMEGTFYTDDASSCQTAMKWLKSHPKIAKVDEALRNNSFHVRALDGLRFADLNIRVGATYLYCHMTNCEHVFSIIDIRLPHGDDENDVAAYPKHVFQRKSSRESCKCCDRALASFVLFDDILSPCSPCYYCEQCFELLHCDSEGRMLQTPDRKNIRIFPYSHTV